MSSLKANDWQLIVDEFHKQLSTNSFADMVDNKTFPCDVNGRTLYVCCSRPKLRDKYTNNEPEKRLEWKIYIRLYVRSLEQGLEGWTRGACHSYRYYWDDFDQQFEPIALTFEDAIEQNAPTQFQFA